eukprot:scaffold73274_cov54-Cyclotella_meneghiniana.AAC.2
MLRPHRVPAALPSVELTARGFDWTIRCDDPSLLSGGADIGVYPPPLTSIICEASKARKVESRNSAILRPS